MLKTGSLWFTFWPGWVLANGFGWLLVDLHYFLPYFGSIGILPLVAAGVLVSVLQWRIFQKNDLGDSLWIWMSVIPYIIFLLVLFSSHSDLTVGGFILIHLVCFGVLGLFQRAALDYYVDLSTLWIIASPVASMLGMLAAEFVSSLLRGPFDSAFYWAFFGTIYGCITGAVIIYLYNSTITDQGSSEFPE